MAPILRRRVKAKGKPVVSCVCHVSVWLLHASGFCEFCGAPKLASSSAQPHATLSASLNLFCWRPAVPRVPQGEDVSNEPKPSLVCTCGCSRGELASTDHSTSTMSETAAESSETSPVPGVGCMCPLAVRCVMPCSFLLWDDDICSMGDHNQPLFPLQGLAEPALIS